METKEFILTLSLTDGEQTLERKMKFTNGLYPSSVETVVEDMVDTLTDKDL